MAATADPNEVIQLPRLRPGDLGTLMLELTSTARATMKHVAEAAKPARKKKAAEADDGEVALPAAFPDRVAEALDDMEATRPALTAALSASDPVTTLTPAQRALDLKMNASWRCVRLTYELGEQLANARGDEAQAQRCRDGRARVLPNGIAFISLVGRDECTLSDVALRVLEGEQASLFRALPGGAELLGELRAVHDGNGEAFHITAASTTKPASPQVARAVADAAAAAREFVAAVIGTVRRADPRTRALADRLLAPLANYGRTPAVPSAPSEKVAKGDPTPPGHPRPARRLSPT